MVATVHVFLSDDSFRNKTSPIRSVFDTPGVGILSSKGSSYFQDIYTITDPRPAASRAVNWTPANGSTILIDNAQYAGFLTQLQSGPVAQLSGIFAIIDELCFSYQTANTQTSLETALTTNATTSPIYVPESLVLGAAPVAATAYNADGSSKSVNIIPAANFLVNINSGSSVTQFEIFVWASDAVFLANYPVSAITAVVPPLPYAALFSAPLTGSTANMFTTALQTSQLSQQTLQAPIATGDNTGFVRYIATLVDTAGNKATAEFNILYRGQIPTTLAIRQAIANALVTSGVGDQVSWRTRIPELFISNQFYLVPMWGSTYLLPNQTIYPTVTTLSVATAKAQKILNTEDAGFIQQHAQLLTAAWNLIQIVGVPNSNNDVSDLSILTEFPTYQSYANTDPSFQYMDPASQQFSNYLNKVLPIAAGIASDPAYPIVTENQLQYISFVVGFVEYCVILQSNFLALGGNT